MNNIGSVHSISPSYLPAFKQKQAANSVTNPINSDVSMNGIDALSNYNIGLVKKQNNEPKYLKQSLEEHLTSLNNSGKKEGIDYSFEKYPSGSVWLELNDKDGNITDRIEYIDGKFSGCEINTYNNGRLVSNIGIRDDRIETSSKMYYRNEYAQEKFTKHRINHETKPEEFAKYLQNNNTKYKIEYEGEEDNNRSVILTEYDNNGKAVRSYWWYYGRFNFNEQFPWVSVSELNEKEEEYRRIIFEEDVTEVCDYNYLSSTKDYNNSEYNIQTLTSAGVTYKTTPKEYMEYLDKKGINYKIKKYAERSGDFEIAELDDKGNTITNTIWVYEPNSNNLERICRWELSKTGRKRFDFYPDTTETMNLRYIN